jgi:hypothetical protein
MERDGAINLRKAILTAALLELRGSAFRLAKLHCQNVRFVSDMSCPEQRIVWRIVVISLHVRLNSPTCHAQ